MRIVVGPGDFARRLVAKSLYGRVEVAKGDANARAGRARGLPRFNRNSTVQFGWPTIADFIRRNMECVRQHAPHRRQSVISDAGARARKVRRKTCASMAGRHCQRSERARHRVAMALCITLETVRKKYPESKAGDRYQAVWKRFFPR